MKNIYLHILDQELVNSSLVLATVTRTNGSTPQKPGSSALFDGERLISGTVGGGIVEGSIQKLAVEAAKTAESGHYHFNLEHDISKTEEAICGGEISVLVDANLNDSMATFKQLRESLSQHIPGVLITRVTNQGGDKILINRYWISDLEKPQLPDYILDKIKSLVNDLLNSKDKSNYRSIELSIPGEELSSAFFLEPVFPPEQLIIAGAGHIGRALAQFGRLLDFEVTVIDNRPEYANQLNIPYADHLIVKDIGEAMQMIPKNDSTYIVILTRGHKDDAEALKPCIGGSAHYIGMIGSRKKIAKMRTNFIDKGWATESDWSKIYAPVGIDIKSQSVEEIAVSIAAQLVLVRNSRSKVL